MSDIQTIINSTNVANSQQSATKKSRDQLGQQDFLRLLIEQFRAQDPTKPTDGTQFLTQMTQFTQVQGIQNLQDSFANLSTSMQTSQGLGAASLVGKQVMVPSTMDTLGADGTMAGAIDVPSGASHVKVQIKDAAGSVVRTIDLGSPSQGNVRFTWDGKNDAGAPMAAGDYSISSTATVGGASKAIDTYAVLKVVGIGFDSSGPLLDLGSLGSVSLSQIREIV